LPFELGDYTQSYAELLHASGRARRWSGLVVLFQVCGVVDLGLA